MDYAFAREKMVRQQIEKRGISNKAVLQAMRTVPRDIFVPDEFLHEAYNDYPLPIGYEQSISQPYIVALMTELLHVKAHHKVLEIGTGCGYQSAVLAQISKRLYTVEIVPELAQLATKKLHQLNYANICFKLGDGLLSWQNEAPFDRIIVTAAPVELPLALVKQLRIGGYMVIPVGSYPQILYRVFRKSETEIDQQAITHVAFVPMMGKVRK